MFINKKPVMKAYNILHRIQIPTWLQKLLTFFQIHVLENYSLFKIPHTSSNRDLKVENLRVVLIPFDLSPTEVSLKTKVLLNQTVKTSLTGNHVFSYWVIAMLNAYQ